MVAVAQCLFLNPASYFKLLMRAFPHVFLKFHIFQKRMRVVDQKYNYQLEWPKREDSLWKFPHNHVKRYVARIISAFVKPTTCSRCVTWYSYNVVTVPMCLFSLGINQRNPLAILDLTYRGAQHECCV